MLVPPQVAPPDTRLAATVCAHHDGLLAEAIRQMARELREYDVKRTAGIDEVLDRTIQYLFNRFGRWPTAAEAAEAAGVCVEDVVDDRLRRSAAR
jgi:hypothetical protein